MTYGEAIREALFREMTQDQKIVLFGEDIRHNLYGYTGGLYDAFGKDRVINIPLSEQAVMGTAIGASICGVRTIIDLTVTNFLYTAMDQIVNMASKIRYMYGGQFSAPLTIMCSSLYNGSNAAQHSDRSHPMFMNVPGLKIVMPATPQDAYSLLRASIQDDNPVLYISDRTLFHKEQYVTLDHKDPIGKANVVLFGDDITIVTISGALSIALDLLPTLIDMGVSPEIIDVRSLSPLDMTTIKRSVKKTGRVIIVDTANRTCSAAAEISSRIAEDAFDSLFAPIGIVSYDDVPVPFAKNLEQKIMPTAEKLLNKIKVTWRQY